MSKGQFDKSIPTNGQVTCDDVLAYEANVNNVAFLKQLLALAQDAEALAKKEALAANNSHINSQTSATDAENAYQQALLLITGAQVNASQVEDNLHRSQAAIATITALMNGHGLTLDNALQFKGNFPDLPTANAAVTATNGAIIRIGPDAKGLYLTYMGLHGNWEILGGAGSGAGTGAALGAYKSESVVLTAGETKVTFVHLIVDATFHINHPRIDSRKLVDSDIISRTSHTITLSKSYPEGTVVTMELNEPLAVPPTTGTASDGIQRVGSFADLAGLGYANPADTGKLVAVKDIQAVYQYGHKADGTDGFTLINRTPVDKFNEQAFTYNPITKEVGWTAVSNALKAYATKADLPATAANGAGAIVQDTKSLWFFNLVAGAWEKAYAYPVGTTKRSVMYHDPNQADAITWEDATLGFNVVDTEATMLALTPDELSTGTIYHVKDTNQEYELTVAPTALTNTLADWTLRNIQTILVEDVAHIPDTTTGNYEEGQRVLVKKNAIGEVVNKSYILSGGAWVGIGTTSTVHDLKTDPDSGNLNSEGDLITVIENGKKAIKVYDAATSTWVTLFDETQIKEWIASASQLKGTVQEQGGTVIGSDTLNTLPPETALAHADSGVYYIWQGTDAHVITASEIGTAVSSVDGRVIHSGDWLQVFNSGSATVPDMKYEIVTSSGMSATRAKGIWSFEPWKAGAFEEGSIVTWKGKLYRAGSPIILADVGPDVAASKWTLVDIASGSSGGTKHYDKSVQYVKGDLLVVDSLASATGHPAQGILWYCIKDMTGTSLAEPAEAPTDSAAKSNEHWIKIAPDTGVVPFAINTYLRKGTITYVPDYTDSKTKPTLYYVRKDFLATGTIETASTAGDVSQLSGATLEEHPILYVGDGLYDATHILSNGDNYGFPTNTVPSPTSKLPQTGDRYLDTGSTTLYTFTGTPHDDRATSTITGVVTSELTNSRAIQVDGTSKVLDDISLTNNKLTDVGDAVLLSDAVNLGLLENKLRHLTTGMAHGESVVSNTVTTPPTPAVGNLGSIWIVPHGATGAWQTHDDSLAVVEEQDDGTFDWMFVAPRAQETHLVEDTSESRHWNGTAWVKVAGIAKPHPLLGWLHDKAVTGDHSFGELDKFSFPTDLGAKYKITATYQAYWAHNNNYINFNIKHGANKLATSNASAGAYRNSQTLLAVIDGTGNTETLSINIEGSGGSLHDYSWIIERIK